MAHDVNEVTMEDSPRLLWKRKAAQHVLDRCKQTQTQTTYVPFHMTRRNSEQYLLQKGIQANPLTNGNLPAASCHSAPSRAVNSRHLSIPSSPEYKAVMREINDAKLAVHVTEPEHVTTLHVAQLHVTQVLVTPVHVTPVRLNPVHVTPVRLNPVHVTPLRLNPVHVTPEERDVYADITLGLNKELTESEELKAAVMKCRRWLDNLPDKFSGLSHLNMILPGLTHSTPDYDINEQQLGLY